MERVINTCARVTVQKIIQANIKKGEVTIGTSKAKVVQHMVYGGVSIIASVSKAVQRAK
jgi:hypothetical protein